MELISGKFEADGCSYDGDLSSRCLDKDFGAEDIILRMNALGSNHYNLIESIHGNHLVISVLMLKDEVERWKKHTLDASLNYGSKRWSKVYHYNNKYNVKACLDIEDKSLTLTVFKYNKDTIPDGAFVENVGVDYVIIAQKCEV